MPLRDLGHNYRLLSSLSYQIWNCEPSQNVIIWNKKQNWLFLLFNVLLSTVQFNFYKASLWGARIWLWVHIKASLAFEILVKYYMIQQKFLIMGFCLLLLQHVHFRLCRMSYMSIFYVSLVNVRVQLDILQYILSQTKVTRSDPKTSRQLLEMPNVLL